MTLVFIYNANSGKFNALIDAGHKLLSPSTYQCSLCALTFDIVSENSTWKAFRTHADLEMEFYHKDEFENKFPNTNLVYPSILILNKGKLKIILDHKDLNEMTNVDELIEKLKTIL